jgi:hypothetical protein
MMIFSIGMVFPGHQVLIEGERVSTAKSSFVAPHEQDGKALKGPSLGVWEGRERELEEHIDRVRFKLPSQMFDCFPDFNFLIF